MELETTDPNDLHCTNDVCEVLFKYPLYDVVLVRDGDVQNNFSRKL